MKLSEKHNTMTAPLPRGWKWVKTMDTGNEKTVTLIKYNGEIEYWTPTPIDYLGDR